MVCACVCGEGLGEGSRVLSPPRSHTPLLEPPTIHTHTHTPSMQHTHSARTPKWNAPRLPTRAHVWPHPFFTSGRGARTPRLRCWRRPLLMFARSPAARQAGAKVCSPARRERRPSWRVSSARGACARCFSQPWLRTGNPPGDVGFEAVGCSWHAAAWRTHMLGRHAFSRGLPPLNSCAALGIEARSRPLAATLRSSLPHPRPSSAGRPPAAAAPMRCANGCSSFPVSCRQCAWSWRPARGRGQAPAATASTPQRARRCRRRCSGCWTPPAASAGYSTRCAGCA